MFKSFVGKYELWYKLSGQTSLMALSSIITQILTFVALFVYTAYLLPQEYAEVATYESILFLFQASIGIALVRSAQRFYVDHDGDYIISLACSLAIVSASLIFIVVVGLFALFPESTVAGIGRSYFLAIYISSVGYMLHEIVLVKFQFRREPLNYFLTSISKTLVFFIISTILLHYFRLNEEAWIYASLSTGIFLIGMSLWITSPTLISLKDIALCRNMILYSAPFVPTLIAAWVVNWSSRLFFQGVADPNDVAVFAVAQRVAMSFFVLTHAVTIAITPILYELLKNNDTKSAKEMMINSLSFFLLGAITIVFFLPDILNIFVGPEYGKVKNYLAIMIVVNYVSAVLGITSSISFGFYKHTSAQMNIFLITSLLCLVLNFWLIPLFGINAAILIMIITSITMFFLNVWVCHRITNIDLPILKILGFIAALICVSNVGNLIEIYITTSYVLIAIKLAIVGVFGFLTLSRLMMSHE